MKPMLAQSIEPERLPRYCKDDAWGFQQKIDGHRKLVAVSDGVVTVVNRGGQATDLPPFVKAALARMNGGPWLLDGELLLGVLYLFDLVQAGDLVDAITPFIARFQTLEALMSIAQLGPAVVVVPTAIGQEAKGKLAQRIIENQGEGVIVRKLASAYEPGVRSRQLLKAKFVKTADCVVTGLRSGGKHNMVLACYDRNGKTVMVGECTAHAGDGPRVKVNDVVEVRYLYFGAQGRLVQPTFPKIRTDKRPEECTMDQLLSTNKTVLA